MPQISKISVEGERLLRIEQPNECLQNRHRVIVLYCEQGKSPLTISYTPTRLSGSSANASSSYLLTFSGSHSLDGHCKRLMSKSSNWMEEGISSPPGGGGVKCLGCKAEPLSFTPRQDSPSHLEKPDSMVVHIRFFFSKNIKESGTPDPVDYRCQYQRLSVPDSRLKCFGVN